MDYRIASDNELFQYCKQDDIRSFNEIFDRFVGRLHRTGMKYLQDSEAVEEIVSDVLVDIWIRRHEIELESQLSTYLFKALQNKSISFLRRRKMNTTDINEVSEGNIIATEAADNNISVQEIQYTIERQLLNLTPQRQKAFRLSREQDMSYAEIAGAMGISINTVKNHINAALDQLRKGCQHDMTSIYILFFLSAVTKFHTGYFLY